MKCPKCNSEEVDAMKPRTVYECGSSDYDQRPGTFIQSDKCEEQDIEQWSRLKSVEKGYDGSVYQSVYEEGFIDAIKWYKEQLKQKQ